MSNALTMDSFSRAAVEDFVQTVVFVDDKIYAPSPTGTVIEEKKASGPKVRKPATKIAEEKIPNVSDDASEAPVEVPPFSPHDIQASFAKKRIVCSLHQPIKKNSVGIESDTYKLCASADIVIVDWDLHGDAGEKAKTLIENLVLQSLQEDPHQLRLVLVYTDNPNLFDIADKVSEKLTAKLTDKIEHKAADKGLAFHTLNARVVVLGKPASRPDQFKPFEVNEAELADRAVSEFCKLTDGLLQGGILMGLATIRKQSRKILTKFHSGLDAAFLTHRALSLPHEEAFDHITPLLVAEIQAVLEDTLGSPLFPDSVVDDWCNRADLGKHAEALIHGAAIKSFAADFCRFGYEATSRHQLNPTPSKKQLQSLLCPDDKSAPPQPDMSTMEQLAVLMSQRTHYDNQRRFLKLGAILRESKGKKRYLLCLQPLCDSVRLTGSNPFLFCYLDESPKKATHIVPAGNNHCELLLNPTKENRAVIEFSANHKKRVAADGNTDSGYLFSDDKKNEYQWIAQLKPEHAQRAAEQFARELSRVGLTESEWLRLKAS
ncbi:response regulator receiver domain [Geobacter sp.]|uniref:response regulator receiver domain n=1 Tax=Geobacter sp. TaxID=46610 RepID=UPI00263321FA|nr:response regulator receiver domain [Geobacter sp.]